jgi:hypothetical protein
MPVDALLATGTRMQAIADQLADWLPEPGGTPITVYVDDPGGTKLTPFVVLVATLTPIRIGLGGKWSMAELRLGAHTVHNSPAEARALADLVRTWVLTVMAIPGQQDVEPADPWRGDDPGGVHQGYESWSVTLTRT